MAEKVKKDKLFTMRVTESELAHMKTLAESFNMSLAELVMMRLSDTQPSRKTVVKKKDDRIIFQLSKIGNNLNQIARQCNIEKKVDREVLMQLSTIEKKIDEIIKKC